MSNIRKFLDLSTGHLCQTMRDMLDRDHDDLPYILKGRYGWFVYVPPSFKDIERLAWEHAGPTSLILCMRHARENDCDYILFDADAPPDDALPWFEDEPATS